MTARYVVEADGGSRGNPGQAAYGALVRDGATGEVLIERGERIGIASNNVAEYRGLIAGLEAVAELDPEARVDVRMDSKLVVEQMSGRWQVKHPDMKVLAKRAFAAFPHDRVTYQWIPREKNKAADRLVNAALDGQAIDSLPVLDANDDPGRTATAGGAHTSAVTASTTRRPLGSWALELGPPLATVLVRHGETELTRERRFSGSGGADPGLTELGQQQAVATGQMVAGQMAAGQMAAGQMAAGQMAAGQGLEIAAVVSSPSRRARETASVVADALGLADITVDEDFREAAFGDWDGYSHAEIAQRWPRELAAWLASTAVAPPFGESFDALAVRVAAARARLAEAYDGRTVVVVTHGCPIKLLVAQALSAPPDTLFCLEVGPASATTIDWWSEGGARLRAFNVTTPPHP